MTSRTSLRWRLRDATAAAHGRLDATVGGAFADRVGYAAFLRGMERFVAIASAVTGDPALAPARAALAADLATLGTEPLEPVAAMRTDAATALGWRYVLAGSSLGARLLLPRAQSLGLDGHHGARYLALQAASGTWRALQPALDVVVAPRKAAAAIAGARAAFACAHEAMAEASEGVTA